MADLGLADSFETVRDLAGIADLGDRVARGVILAVPSVAGGEPRWWRLAAMGRPTAAATWPSKASVKASTVCPNCPRLPSLIG
jgi:hypothetical protein